jgi:sulfite reductase (ferredoxin)
MLQIPQSVRNDIHNYRNKVSKYVSGELDKKNFKPYGAAMGVYAERSGDTFMVRPRIPSGVVSLNELKRISEIAEKYSNGKLHFTTRQDVQFHGVSFENTVEIVEELLEIGVVTRGTGGNTARNVSCSPLSGLEKNEVFDVSPYALAVGEFLLKDGNNFVLPRKYKIGFSNNDIDEGHAKISDLGFVAVNDPKHGEGFRVYGGGGLGGAPKPAIILREFAAKDEVIYHAQAMKLLFEEHGDRQNKAKARIRHIVRRLGEEKFLEEYNRFYKIAQQDKTIDNSELCKYLKIYEAKSELDAGSEATNINSTSITELRAENRYSVYFQPENGNIYSDQLNKLIEVLEKLDYEFSLRLSLAQGIYVNNIDGKDVEAVVEAGESIYSANTIEKSTACTGASTCQLGICRAQDLSSAIKNKFESESEKLKNILPKIYISGCPNSCGQHQIGEIGITGKVKKENGNLLPVYSILFGGNLNKELAEFGEVHGTLAAKAIPDFLLELAKLREKSNEKNFDEFVTAEKENLESLINTYSVIPSIEEKPDFYKDFGSDEFFSLKK